MTFTIKLRGTPGPIAAEYLCPEHGRFDLVVQRDANGDPPAEMKCEAWLPNTDPAHPSYPHPVVYCGEWCSHVISAPSVKKFWKPSAVVKGKADDKPSPLHMDHSAVADGKISMGEWQEKRDRVWADWRRDEVKKATS
jgi:hypothetical protein